MATSRRAFLLGLAAASGAAGLTMLTAACSAGTTPSPAPGQAATKPERSFKIAYLSLGWAGIEVTRQLGLLEQRGWNIEWQAVDVIPGVINAFSSGQADLIDMTTVLAAQMYEGGVKMSIFGVGVGALGALVAGTGSSIRALLNSELVDELQLFVLPILLGGGLRFFPDGLTPATWRLVSVATFPTGNVALRYGRPWPFKARMPRGGSVPPRSRPDTMAAGRAPASSSAARSRTCRRVPCSASMAGGERHDADMAAQDGRGAPSAPRHQERRKIVPAREPEHVDYLLAEAFNAQNLDACVALYDPEASVVRLDIFGGTIAKGDQGIREVMADYVGLEPRMDVAIHHVTRAGDYALVRSQWRITGTGKDGKPIELHHHGMEVMRRQPNGEWRFFIDHPYGADSSWAVPAERIPPSAPSGHRVAGGR